MKKLLVLLTLAVLAGVGVVGGTSAAPAPRFSASSNQVDNQWFPLKPGTTLVYRGSKDRQAARDVLTVTNRTSEIHGVRCVVIDDRLYLNGRLGERTTDWYAQDVDGNVWYFGESTGRLNAAGQTTSTDGTWRAGRDGALPGIFMSAHPQVGQSFRQEYYKGHAEDHFRVLSLAASVRTPAAASSHALLTQEWTPLEPGVLDHKLYVRGIGTVIEEAVKGGTERLVLVAVHHA